MEDALDLRRLRPLERPRPRLRRLCREAAIARRRPPRSSGGPPRSTLRLLSRAAPVPPQQRRCDSRELSRRTGCRKRPHRWADRYQLTQFHFHRPSEETVDGKAYAMEIHLMHQSSDGRAVGVTVFLREGASNATVRRIWDHMPERVSPETEIPGVQIDPAGLLPHDLAYYRYAGSLTAPPCTEGVSWIVLRSPVEISRAQIDAFARLYPHNVRSSAAAQWAHYPGEQVRCRHAGRIILAGANRRFSPPKPAASRSLCGPKLAPCKSTSWR